MTRDANSAAAAIFVLGTRALVLDCPHVEFNLAPHVAFRAESRGYVHEALDCDVNDLKKDAITHLAQPSAGIVFR